MIVHKTSEIEKSQVTKEGVKDVWIQWLIGEKSRAPNFYLRLFEVGAGGHTPFHSHSWEHEVYILKGSGVIHTSGESISIETGHFVLIEPGEKHQFENKGDQKLTFLCIIPKEGL
jgi:quercetin dioxygenase-like cupin family protein